MNVGEYGTVYRFDAGEDISATTPTIVFEPQFGEALVVTDLTIPAVTITIDGQEFAANEYVEYTFKDGDLSYAGRWRAKLLVEVSPTVKWVSDYDRFTVLP